MKHTQSMSWARCACLVLLAAPLAAHAAILGILGNLAYRIDETTGAVVALSNNSGNAIQAKAMAKNSAGVIYVAGGAGSSKLWTVDPASGVATAGPDIHLNNDVSIEIQGLAFNSADVLYAVNNPTPGQFNAPWKLYTIDTTTGLGTFVGLVNGVVLGLEFSPGGVLYGWESTLGLVTINPASGAVTDVNPAIGATSQIWTLAFAPSGTLYGAFSSLYTIDTTTGALTLVAALNPATIIQGMEFVSGGPPGGPVVALTPPSLAFGSQQVGTTSAVQTLTLQNTGTGVLNLAGIAASGDFAQTNTCGATLAATASCAISVTFTPTTSGVRNGAITVTSNAPGSPHSSTLSGTGSASPPPPPPPAPSAPIPALSLWALIALGLLVMWAAGLRLRGR